MLPSLLSKKGLLNVCPTCFFFIFGKSGWTISPNTFSDSLTNDFIKSSKCPKAVGIVLSVFFAIYLIPGGKSEVGTLLFPVLAGEDISLATKSCSCKLPGITGLVLVCTLCASDASVLAG